MNKAIVSKRTILVAVFFTLLLTTNEAFAQNDVRIINRWHPTHQINIQEDLTVSEVQPNWWSALWHFEKVKGTDFYRIKCKWNKNGKVQYLHNQSQKLEVGNIQSGWWSAMWTLEKVEGYFRIKNRWTGEYIHNQNQKLELGRIQSDWRSAMWTLKGFSTDAPTTNTNTENESTLFDVTEIRKVKCEGNLGYVDPICLSVGGFLYKVNVAGYVERSTDAGRSWTAMDKKMAEISAVDNDVVWGISFDDKISITTDGGENWNQVSGRATRISAINEKVAWVINEKSKRIYATQDGGKSWTQVPRKADYVCALSYEIAWVINDGNLYYTSDFGTKWTKMKSNVKMVSSVQYGDVWCIDNKTSYLYYSSDNGKTWKTDKLVYQDVVAIQTKRAYAQMRCGDLMLLEVKD